MPPMTGRSLQEEMSSITRWTGSDRWQPPATTLQVSGNSSTGFYSGNIWVVIRHRRAGLKPKDGPPLPRGSWTFALP